MFYPVRVLDSKNHLKEIISVKELRIKHWAEYEKNKRFMPQLGLKKT